jgi:serine protease Do
MDNNNTWYEDKAREASGEGIPENAKNTCENDGSGSAEKACCENPGNNYAPREQNENKDASKKQRRSFSFGTLIACMLITALLAGGAGGLLAGLAQNGTSATEVLPAAADNEAGKPSADLLAATSEGVKDPAGVTAAASPTVVFIRIEQEGTNYFGQQETAIGSGSGVIITSDGYIATNNHVVNGAGKITVTLTDGREFEAKVVGADNITDLAVIKIEASGLKPAVLGSSSALAVGDEVIAIGNPLGELASTVTKGIISALDREITVEGQKMSLLQTDASINPGNSGGGLFNMKGELVGIVNAKSMALEVEGLGFAIPIDSAKTVLADLMDNGFVSGRPYLGVSLQDIMLVANGGGSGNGGPFGFFDRQQYITRVQIMSVQDGSAAAAAGLRENDYILKLNGTDIENSSHFTSLISEYAAGDVVTLSIQRGNQTQDVSVTLGERSAG